MRSRENEREAKTDLVVEIAFAQDELSQTPFDGEDVGEDAGDGGGDLHAREVERAGSGRGRVLRRGEQGQAGTTRRTLRAAETSGSGVSSLVSQHSR